MLVAKLSLGALASLAVLSWRRFRDGTTLLGADDKAGVAIIVTASLKLGGARTILVRSGISGMIELEHVPEGERPDEVVDGVAELLDLL